MKRAKDKLSGNARLLTFGFRHSFVIRHSCFVILIVRVYSRHSLANLVPVGVHWHSLVVRRRTPLDDSFVAPKILRSSRL